MALISYLRAAEKIRKEKETFRGDFNPLSKHRVLGTVIGRHGGAKHVVTTLELHVLTASICKQGHDDPVADV